jgi:ABC-2 type transport system permease protein
MLAWVLARGMFESRLQYSASHAVRTAASVIFGLIYASIWKGIGEQHALGAYGKAGMTAYIAFNQVILWISFTRRGLGLEERVRTGQIALDLARPIGLFAFAAWQEAGSILYNALFTAVPLYLVYVGFLGLPVQRDPLVWLWTVAALAAAAFASVCIAYLIGVAALWTVESRWLDLFNYTLNFLLSGFLIPIEWMPGPLRTVAEWSPYPLFQSIPAQLYLGKAGPERLLQSLFWCVLFALLAAAATRIVKRKVEVQGG